MTSRGNMPLGVLEELKKYNAKIETRGSKLKIVSKKELPQPLLKRIKQIKSELIANLPPQEPCYACGDYNWWLSIHNVWVCGTCHPPACEKLVKYAVSKDLKCLDEVIH